MPLCNWYNVLGAAAREIFEHDEDHGGEMETSFGLAYFSHLVAKTADGKLTADNSAVDKTRFDAINNGWVSITRNWKHSPATPARDILTKQPPKKPSG